MFEYNQFQQFYALSSASNAVGSTHGTEKDLQDAMDETLKTHIPQLDGGWEVTWGPRVYKSDPTDTTMGPDNAWFAAVSEKQRICVVAVAGTSATSKPGWWIDFDVENVVDFADWTSTWVDGITAAKTSDPVPGRAYASQGTCIGVHNILDTPSTLAAKSLRLGDYIANSIMPTGYDVIFTGHSLGGAVAPTVALGLVQAKMSEPGKTFILPSAGASAGNAEFVKASTGVFPPGAGPRTSDPYAILNTDFFNTQDIVPQAWSLDSSTGRYLENILNIYSKTGIFIKAIIDLTVAYAMWRPFRSGIQYVPLPGTSFTGPPVSPVHTLCDLTAAVSCQHTRAYWDFIGIGLWVYSFTTKLTAHDGVDPLPDHDLVPQAKHEVSDL